MATELELRAVAEAMIRKLHAEVNELQAKALRLSAESNFEELSRVLRQQRDALDAQIAMVDATRYLNRK